MLLDLCLDRFKWYRRLRGGVWYHVWELYFFQGGFEFWTREERFYPGIPKYVWGWESYSGVIPKYLKKHYHG